MLEVAVQALQEAAGHAQVLVSVMLPVWPGGQARVLVSAGFGSHFWQVPPIQEVHPSGAVVQNSFEEQETLQAGGGGGVGGTGGVHITLCSILAF